MSDSFLDIDEFNLDREWIEQPKLYGRWARKAADARLRMDEAKARLELVQAELDLEVRSDPEKFDVVKVTENTVKAAILQDVRWIAAQKKVNEARHDHEVMQAAVSALDHRKRALEKLVDLFLASYYAEPRASSGSREGIEEMTKRSVRRKGRRRVENDG